jgi:sugar phosphate isomerase/epimerase
MTWSRRDFVKLGLAALPAVELARLTAQARPNSKFAGVQIGAIVSPYNFPSIPVAADEFLHTLVQVGLSAVEIQDVRCEVYAGAPNKPREGYSGSPQLSPEARAAARQKQAEDLRKWRLENTAAILDKLTTLRRMYDDAGVSIYAFRLANTTMDMTDAEYDYFFRAAHVLGANQITTELPDDPALSQRLGELGEKHKMMLGYHNHTQVNALSWDLALKQSKWNGIQLDIGHYVAAVNGSPIPFIKEHHDRITSIHLKDRKYGNRGGANLPWGEGDTPVKEVLLLMRDEHYGFPAGIELEYKIPEGSTPEQEIKNCIDFSRRALL